MRIPNHIISLVFCLLIPFGLSAYTVEGRVTDTNGDALPYVNIYVKGTTQGTTSNAEGYYAIKLNKGQYQLVFQSIGYAKQLYSLEVEGNMLFNVQLKAEQIQIEEVIVTDEDPAYRIIRKVQEKRQYHLDQVESYTCKAYVKGMQRITKAPNKVLGQELDFNGSLDKNNQGIIYLSESESILEVKKPNDVKETVISSKVAGDDQGLTWNMASDFYVNFYNNSQDAEWLSERVLISPIADNSFFFYDYQYLGLKLEDDMLVHQIKVIPKRKNDPVFSGVINIVDGLWNIYSLELFATRDNQLNFVDTLKVTQYYVPVTDSIWMPMQQRFDIDLNVLGVEGEGYYLGIFRDYEVNLNFPKKHFNNEIIVYTEDATERDSVYWEEIRPVPLTTLETKDYIKKDSLAVLRETPEFKSAQDAKANKFGPLDIINGYTYRNSNQHFYFRTNSLLNLVNYNTVEGWNLTLSPWLRKYTDDIERNHITMDADLRYGFASNQFYYRAKALYLYNSEKYEFARIGGGNYVFQLSDREPLTEFDNTLYSLFSEQNYMKLYSQAYVRFTYQRELWNGVVLNSDLEFANRKPLFNQADYTFFDWNKHEFTDNNPQLAADPDYIMPSHESIKLRVILRFRFDEKFFKRPGLKITLDSKYPELHLLYEKGIKGVLFGQTDYDYLRLRISQKIPLKLLGTSMYNVSFGKFLNKRSVELPDYAHFEGNQTLFGKNYQSGYQLLPYYTYSTKNWFTEAHYEHHFNGFIFNKIPFFRKLRWQAVGGVHFLYTPTLKDYYEIDAGIENIFSILRVDFVSSFGATVKPDFGVRIGVSFGLEN